MKGQCFPYAVQQAMKFGVSEPEDTFAVAHGVVHEPCAVPPRRYVHAWIEWGGTVYDWQTMLGGSGGKYNGKGYPKNVFYEVYKPECIRTYTAEQAMVESLKHRHPGPWTEEFDDVIAEQFDRERAARVA